MATEWAVAFRTNCPSGMTGAPLPDGADTVIMQEYVERDGDKVTITDGNKPGADARVVFLHFFYTGGRRGMSDVEI